MDRLVTEGIFEEVTFESRPKWGDAADKENWKQREEQVQGIWFGNRCGKLARHQEGQGVQT